MLHSLLQTCCTVPLYREGAVAWQEMGAESSEFKYFTYTDIYEGFLSCNTCHAEYTQYYLICKIANKMFLI